MSATLNSIGQRLYSELTHAVHVDDAAKRELSRTEKVNVVGAGGALTAAYEQLRNAAENTEEHLLLQNAIRRFFKQLFITRDDNLIRTSGNELVIELTLAGYVPNNSLSKSILADISDLATRHYAAYEALQHRRGIGSDTSTTWILDTLAVSVEALISSHERDKAFVNVAYEYFQTVIPTSADKSLGDNDFGAALFVAVQKALLKSDTAAIRTGLLARYGVTVDDLDQFVKLNAHIDTLVKSSGTDTLYRIVDRQGAPFRIIRRMIETHPDLPSLLMQRENFLEAFEQQVTKEYSRIMTRVNRAIVRSVLFLIVTKFLIGIAIEVPYDFWAHGGIEWLPLIMNLFFPPLYMVALRLTLNLPGYANTRALTDRADTILYGEGTMLIKKQLGTKEYSPLFSAIYIIFSLIIFGVVMWGLLLIGFSLVHIAIFLVFISAASFLGFRLSRLIRELEVVRSASNGLTMIRDFIYLPFVVVGRWMSEKYSQVNIVAVVLDMLIELPLKTILRLIRQWGAFIDDRKDRI